MAEEERVYLEDLTFKHRTEDAILVVNMDLEDVWVPLSQLSSIEHPTKDTVSMGLPQWLAEEKGLV